MGFIKNEKQMKENIAGRSFPVFTQVCLVTVQKNTKQNKKENLLLILSYKQVALFAFKT